MLRVPVISKYFEQFEKSESGMDFNFKILVLSLILGNFAVQQFGFFDVSLVNKEIGQQHKLQKAIKLKESNGLGHRCYNTIINLQCIAQLVEYSESLLQLKLKTCVNFKVQKINSQFKAQYKANIQSTYNYNIQRWFGFNFSYTLKLKLFKIQNYQNLFSKSKL